MKRVRVQLLAGLAACLMCGIARTQPTPEQIFQSVSDNMNHHDNDMAPTKVLAVVASAAGFVLLLTLLKLRTQRTAVPKAVNHGGKLMKELAKAIQLKPAEVKQLKSLADSQDVHNPLVLLLCPSLLAKAVKEHPEKIDRTVVAGLAKRVVASRAD